MVSVPSSTSRLINSIDETRSGSSVRDLPKFEILGKAFTSTPVCYLVFGIAIFCAISISCAALRATWAFARDRAIPFHRTFSVPNSRLSDIPLNAIFSQCPSSFSLVYCTSDAPLPSTLSAVWLRGDGVMKGQVVGDIRTAYFDRYLLSCTYLGLRTAISLHSIFLC